MKFWRQPHGNSEGRRRLSSIPEELGFQARSGLDRFNLGHRVPSAICGHAPIKRIDISMAKSRCGHSASLDRVMPVGLLPLGVFNVRG